MKPTNKDEHAPPLQAGETCDCGHPQDKGFPCIVAGQKVLGWQWAYSIDMKRRLCPACQQKQMLDCGHEIGKHEPFTSGYATTRDGARKICYVCADAQQREQLKDRSKPVYAYVSSDGKRITTWTGGELMRIEKASEWRMNFGFQCLGLCVSATDCHGKRWHGRGAGVGMCITLRPSKTAKSELQILNQ